MSAIERATILPKAHAFRNDVRVPALRAVRVSLVKGVDGELVATIEQSAGVRVNVQPTAANSNGATVRARKMGKQ